MPNEVMKSLLTRRSVRAFTDEKIPLEVLQEIVKAGSYAPSGMNRQTWEFTVLVSEEKIAKLIEIIGQELGRSDYNMYNPTAIIIPTNLRDSALGRDDNACALENIFLSAHSFGVGSVWINQLSGLCDRENVRIFLSEIGIPENHIAYGIAALGYRDKTVPLRETVKKCVIRYV